jgi:hypothetical protein
MGSIVASQFIQSWYIFKGSVPPFDFISLFDHQFMDVLWLTAALLLLGKSIGFAKTRW